MKNLSSTILSVGCLPYAAGRRVAVCARPHTMAAAGKIAIVAILILSSLAPVTYSQGFGILKKDTHFSRLRPPRLSIKSFDVGVRVDGAYGVNASEFKSQVEHEIRTGDERFNLKVPSPQFVIACQVSGLSRSETSKTKSEYQTQKVGEKEVWNEKKKKMEKKDVRESVKVDVRYINVAWEMTISFRIVDTANATVLASDSNLFTEQKEFKESSYSKGEPATLKGWMARQAKEVASYVAPTKEEVRILLPKGKLDDISDKIEKGQLTEALQELEDMPGLRKQEDEAYKFYILGACYEAMGYVNNREDSAARYFEQAANNYAKALAIKTDEKYFREAQERLGTSIDYHNRLKSFYAASRKTPKEGQQTEAPGTSSPASLFVPPIRPAANGNVTPPAKTEPAVNRESKNTTEPKNFTEPRTAPPAKSSGEAKASESLTNETIITLVKAGLSEENVIATINEASATNFDLSANAQVQLIQAKVTNRIISAMRQAKKSK
jgi:hypothetical protein